MSDTSLRKVVAMIATYQGGDHDQFCRDVEEVLDDRAACGSIIAGLIGMYASEMVDEAARRGVSLDEYLAGLIDFLDSLDDEAER